MKTEVVTFTASILINAGLLMSVDHASQHYQKEIFAQQVKMAKMKKGADSLSFEFVEAPPNPYPIKPAKTHRISNRDAVNQDLTTDKKAAQEAPMIKTKGPADQLAQKKMEPTSPPSMPSPAMMAKQAVPETKPQPKEEIKRPEPKTPQDLEGIVLKKEELPVSKPVEASIPMAHPQKATPASIPSPATPPAQAPSGADKISTAQISKTRSRGAQLYGTTSFEATGSGMGVYMKHLKEKIWLTWFPYLVIHYPKDFQSADAVLSFVLDAKGQVKSVQLLESSGSPLFSSFCMETIQKASPFGPLPQEIMDLVGKEELEIKFAFHYW